jgi:hypothetical protein
MERTMSVISASSLMVQVSASSATSSGTPMMS